MMKAEDRRAVLLAVLGAAVALLIAQAFGDSGDGQALAGLLGASAGVVTHRLATRVRQERVLAAVAAVAAGLAVPGARRWAAGLASSSAKTGVSLVGVAVATAGVGAAIGLAMSGTAAPRDTPEAAIAAYLKDKGGEYVGSCAGRSQAEFDAHPRRVCSSKERAQDGGWLFGLRQPGWMDQFPVVLLRHDKSEGWHVVRCVVHC
jgi:hypothetical protein